MKHNWEYKRLGDVCINYDAKRKPVTKSNRVAGPYPYFGATGQQDSVDNYIFDGRYLLIGEDGGKWGPKEKTSYIVEGKVWVNNHAHVLQFDEEICDSFVCFYLNFADLTKYITGCIVPKLNQANLNNIYIPVPNFVEQKRIVSELDEINELIATRKEQLKELDNLAQSLFYDTFGDPITNPKGWEVKKLGDNCEISSAKRVLVQDVVEEGIPFIRGTELAVLSRQNSYDDSIFTMFITPEHYERVKAITGVPTVGDLLIPSINADGYVWEVNTTKPLYFKDGRVLWVHVNKEFYSSKWLRFALSKIIQVKYANLSRGAVFAELTLIFLRNLSIFLPPLSLQQQFAAQVEAIEAQKGVLNESLKELQTLLDSRMDYWFN